MATDCSCLPARTCCRRFATARRSSDMRKLAVLVSIISACATSRTGKFADRPIAWRVDDAHEIKEPAAREFYLLRHFTDGFVFDPVDRALKPTRGRALDTNALDEVPDSAWFQ